MYIYIYIYINVHVYVYIQEVEEARRCLTTDVLICQGNLLNQKHIALKTRQTAVDIQKNEKIALRYKDFYFFIFSFLFSIGFYYYNILGDKSVISDMINFILYKNYTLLDISLYISRILSKQCKNICQNGDKNVQNKILFPLVIDVLSASLAG
jgi:hypothetical protein